MSDRAEELRDERALAAWRAEQQLLRDLIAYVRARAPRCMCGHVAFWRWSSPRAASGCPRDELVCDEHKKDGAVAIPGVDVLRRVTKR